MMPKNYFNFLAGLALVIMPSLTFGQNVALTYAESQEDFMNPDRGFYTHTEGIASRFQPLTVDQLRRYRNQAYTPQGANYAVRSSLVLRLYVLDAFLNAPISSSFLTKIQQDFNAAREAGVRLILRFTYTITPKSGSCGEKWICPPYGDAPKALILQHIQQLKPYLQSNSDVIAVVQSGFIGVWGEQYYTDHFGDASSNGARKLSDQNWRDRLEVLRALLDAVPSNRMVQVRYPQIKQKMIYGIQASVNSAPLSASQAFSKQDIARIGFHNDCFLSAPDDTGTYWDYGTSNTPVSNQTTALKSYFVNDSKYVAVGGETCMDSFNPQSDCNGIALSSMNDLNYSFLNAGYSVEVNNDWQDGKCMDQIKNRLGYRLVMKKGTFPTQFTVGGTLSLGLELENVGFTAPFNERALILILRNSTTAQEYKIAISGANTDSRFWLPGTPIQLNSSITLPGTIPAGKYTLLLQIADKSGNDQIANRPEYCIRMANEGTWEAQTGYNQLKHTLTISTAGSTNLPSAPSNLSASSNTSAQITLRWRDNSNNETGFQVERSANGGSTFELIGTTGSNIVTFVSDKLSPDTKYSFRVRAINANGGSSYSNIITTSTLPLGVNVDGKIDEWANIPAIASASSGLLKTLKAQADGADLYLCVTGTIGANYSIFLNVDNNANTGLKSGVWIPHGSDYLLQNGILRRYSGGGTDWRWTEVGVNQIGIKTAKNSSVLEVRIPRGNLLNLASSIRVSIESSNANWNREGILPAEGSAQAFFNLPSVAKVVESAAFNVSSLILTKVNIYPNPAAASESITVEYETGDLNEVVYLELYTLAGTLVARQESPAMSGRQRTEVLDIRRLTPGVYVLKMKSGEEVSTYRLSVVR